MKDCGKYLELMQKKMDGELSEIEAKMLARHISVCPACAKDYAAFERMSDAFYDLPEEEPPVELKMMVMAEIMDEKAPAVITKPDRRGIGLLVALAILNGLLFMWGVMPFLKSSAMTQMEIISRFIYRFSLLGRSLISVIRMIFSAFIQAIPWSLLHWTLLPAILLMIFMWTLVRWGKKGGSLT